MLDFLQLVFIDVSMISWIRFGSLEASLNSIRGMYNAMVGDESTVQVL